MSAPATRKYRPETRLVQSGILRSPFGETSEALFLTQGYVYESSAQAEARFKGEDPGYQYSRFANPTVSMMGQLKAGDHVEASKVMFGSCRYVVEEYLPRYGIASTLVNGCNLDEWKNAVRPNSKAFFLETPTNPLLEVIDIAEVAKIAHSAGAKLVVDNMFSTPLWQSPLELGALAVRVRRQTDTAATVAVALADHPKVTRLVYPGRPDHPQADIVAKQMRGGSTLVAFEIKGGKRGAFRFQDALQLVRISNNLGDAKSLITHPATTTHQRLNAAARAEIGVTDGLVRLSAGLEHPDDLVEDILTALKAV